MFITMTDAEIAIAEYLAQWRYEWAVAQGWKDDKWVPERGLRLMIEGIGAELCHCRAFNCYPDFEAKPDHLPSVDVINHDGSLTDVKSTPYRNGHLLVDGKKIDKKPVDYYALWVGEPPIYYYIGWMGWDEFWRQPLKDLGHGLSHAVPQSKLHRNTQPFADQFQETWEYKPGVISLG